MTTIAKSRSLGVVTGLVKEAACLRRASNADMLMVQAVAGQSDEARAAAERMIEHGAAGLVSFGVAGGLDPTLGPGVIVVSASIVSHRVPGQSGGAADRSRHGAADTPASLPAHEPWVSALLQFDGAFDCGAIVGSDAPVMTALDKRKLYRRHSALAVDMESHAVAAVAKTAGVPFVAIRAIGDPAGRSIPRAALSGLAPDGRTRALPVLAGLLRRPGDLTGILRLAKETNRALAALRAIVERGVLEALV